MIDKTITDLGAIAATLKAARRDATVAKQNPARIMSSLGKVNSAIEDLEIYQDELAAAQPKPKAPPPSES